MSLVRSKTVALFCSALFARKRTQIGAALLLLSALPCLAAGTIRVPADYSTIQGAINAATHGDEIIVSPATYVENINFSGKNILLRSTDPTSAAVVAATIINGNQTGPVVTFAGSENSSCILAGFTITNGRADNGGGIAGHGTNATIEHNTIRGNAVVGSGFINGGGGLYQCQGTIRGNTIMDNSCTSSDAILGGGLYQCGGTIEYNTITSNSVMGRLRAYGGGVACCGGLIRNNLIYGNSVRNQLTAAPNEGGGLYDCDGTITNNMIWGNANDAWGGEGGGMGSCRARIENNTIYGNRAAYSGGGLASCFGPIRNCIVWGNTAPAGAQMIFAPTATYCCIQDWTEGGEGNIALDPQLANPANRDFHLLLSSPCIDAGGTVTLNLDFEGDPRPCDFTSLPRGDGSDFDIGADEVLLSVLFDIGWPTTGTVWQTGTIGYLAFACQYLPGPSQADVEVWKGRTSVTSLGRVPCQNGPNTVPVRLPATVPGGSGYRIRMFWTVNRAVNSFSNEFRVSLPVPTFTITWPTTGTVWQAGVERDFTFACARPPTMGQLCVDLWRNHAFERFLTAVPCQPGTNAVPLRLPADVAAGANYQLRLYWTVDPSVCSLSGNFTVIVPPTFAITWPDAATIWRTGATGAVTWTCANLPTPSRMYMDIWRNGKYARYWTQVSVRQGTNSVSLQLPSDLSPGPDYQIRLSWIEDATNCAWSARFSIERAAQPLSVTRFRFYD